MQSARKPRSIITARKSDLGWYVIVVLSILGFVLAIYIGGTSKGKDMLKDGPVWALGAMSGTSLDGVDAAMLRTDGRTIDAFGETGYRPYTVENQNVIRSVLGRERGDDGVSAASEVVENTHAELLSEFTDAEIVGFHGQTISHKPRLGRTCQLGDGTVLAQVLNTPVVWDFRSNDMELGGQGAPLAPVFHFACAKWIGADAPVVFLNIGGVSNLTYVDPRCENPEDTGALLAFDTGPGNAQLNDLMRSRLNKKMDEDGALAATGAVDAGILDAMLGRGYFNKIPPKSLDRNDFEYLSDAVSGLSDADAAATLCATIAAAVVQGMEHCPTSPTRILVTGGGRKNPVIMRMLAAGLDGQVVPVETVGLDGDMLEAQAFAFLAVRVARGLPTSFPRTTGVSAAIGGGIVSRP